MNNSGNVRGGFFEREEIAIVEPTLFDNFAECRTRGQETRHLIMSVKYVVKWLINWKGIRG
jgi:hypothetical protein